MWWNSVDALLLWRLRHAKNTSGKEFFYVCQSHLISCTLSESAALKNSMEAILKVGCTRKSRTLEPSCLKLKFYMQLKVRFNLFALLQNVPLWTVREEGWEWNIVRDLYNQRRNLTCFQVILCSFQEWIGSTSFVHAFLLLKKWSPFFVILFLWFSYLQQIAAFASFPYHCCVSVLLQNTFT